MTNRIVIYNNNISKSIHKILLIDMRYNFRIQLKQNSDKKNQLKWQLQVVVSWLLLGVKYKGIVLIYGQLLWMKMAVFGTL